MEDEYQERRFQQNEDFQELRKLVNKGTDLLVSIKFKFLQNILQRNQSRGFLGNYVSRHLIYVIKQWKETFDSKKITARDLDCRAAKILKAKTQVDKVFILSFSTNS